MKLNCALVQDLLPLYVEDLLQDCNKKLVDEHLEDCADCQALLEQMREDAVSVRHGDDGLQKIRKRLRRNTYVVATVTAFVVIFLALLVWSFFVDGSDVMGYGLIALYMVLPMAALVCSLLIGMRKGKIKWFAPVVFSLIAGLLPLFVFSYTEWGFFLFIFLFALIGCVIGHFVGVFQRRKKK